MPRLPPVRPRRVALAIVVVLAVAGAAPDGGAAGAGLIRPRIVNGSFTNKFPSTVAVLDGGDPGTAVAECTGTLIGCRTVITAAHCVCGDDDTSASCVPDPHAHSVFMQHAGLFSLT